MNSIKVLKKRADLLSKQLGVNKDIFTAALELMENGKIAHPEKVFRDTVAKINRKAKYNFVYIEMGQKNYFLMGDVFPIGTDLAQKIEETQKQHDKSNKALEKEFLGQMLFFYEELDKLSIRGFATGTIKFSQEVQNLDTRLTECLMAVKTTDLKVGGTVKKTKLVTLVREGLGYRLTSKLGEIIFLESDNDEVQQEQYEIIGERAISKTGHPVVVAQKVKQLLAEFKMIDSKQAFKGLSLIYKMNTLVDTLEEIPQNLQNLVFKLQKQQERFVPILSKQIDAKLNQCITELKNIPTVESSDQLNQVFAPVKKMYNDWKVFLNNQEHPNRVLIERVNYEIDLLKQYEARIVHLRQQYDEMEDMEQKNELGKQINLLIQEAHKAIA